MEEGDGKGSNVFKEINVNQFLSVKYYDSELEDGKDREVCRDFLDLGLLVWTHLGNPWRMEDIVKIQHQKVPNNTKN